MGASVGGAAVSPPRTLLETPSWALATVCFVFIFFGIFIDHLIHLLSHWLKKHKKMALFEAVEKIKSVLMLLGFLSLILTILQRPISKICVPKRVGNSMLPCSKAKPPAKTVEHITWTPSFGYSSWPEVLVVPGQGRRLSAQQDSSDHCNSKGKTSLISQKGIKELNNFIFVVAIMQIAYCVITIGLARLKTSQWKKWETEIQTVEHLADNEGNGVDPNGMRLTTHGSRHTSTLLLWTKCFFRQFIYSVTKVDYLNLRRAFITAHVSTNNFQKHVEQSLDLDFKVVVGISPIMWLLVVIFLLIDVHGLNVYLWVSFLPMIMVLAVGTNLEVIVAKTKNSAMGGSVLAQPNGSPFWFNHPSFFLTLLHFTIFLNALEVAFFIWVTLEFGIRSCYQNNVEILVIRLVLAVIIQIICSYITLPLYALVTQMESHYKRTLPGEDVMEVMKIWHRDVKKKRNNKNKKNMPDIENSPHDYSSAAAATIMSSPETSRHNCSQVLRTVAEISAARAGASKSDEITED